MNTQPNSIAQQKGKRSCLSAPNRAFLHADFIDKEPSHPFSTPDLLEKKLRRIKSRSVGGKRCVTANLSARTKTMEVEPVILKFEQDNETDPPKAAIKRGPSTAIHHDRPSVSIARGRSMVVFTRKQRQMQTLKHINIIGDQIEHERKKKEKIEVDEIIRKLEIWKVDISRVVIEGAILSPQSTIKTVTSVKEKPKEARVFQMSNNPIRIKHAIKVVLPRSTLIPKVLPRKKKKRVQFDLPNLANAIISTHWSKEELMRLKNKIPQRSVKLASPHFSIESLDKKEIMPHSIVTVTGDMIKRNSAITTPRKPLWIRNMSNRNLGILLSRQESCWTAVSHFEGSDPYVTISM